MKSFKATFNLNQSPETAYEHWISPKTIIPPATSLEIEPIVGGKYKLELPGGASMIGKIIEIEPSRKLIYSWQWQGDPEITKVDVRFTRHNVGTKVKITHSGFSTEKSLKNHSLGWKSYIEGFRKYLENVT